MESAHIKIITDCLKNNRIEKNPFDKKFLSTMKTNIMLNKPLSSKQVMSLERIHHKLHNNIPASTEDINKYNQMIVGNTLNLDADHYMINDIISFIEKNKYITKDQRTYLFRCAQINPEETDLFKS